MANNGATEDKRIKLGEKGNSSIEEERRCQKALEDIDDCQSQIDNLNEQASEEILAVEVRYNSLRKPHYAKRAEIISKVPRFWVTTFMNHPQLSQMIPEEQQHCLQYMQNLIVEEFEDIKNGYKIILKFDSNPYFENDTLVKEYHLGGNGTPKSVVTPINWKPGKNFLADTAEKNSRKRKASESSFFAWFTDTKHSNMDEVADILKDELWVSPLQYFLLPEVEEEGDDDDELDGDQEESGDEEDEADAEENDEA